MLETGIGIGIEIGIGITEWRMEIGNWKRMKFNQKCSYRPNCQRVRNRSLQSERAKEAVAFVLTLLFSVYQ
jgi:hypothetical protein